MSPRWEDALAASYRRRLGRPPTVFELKSIPPEVEKEATDEVLRFEHAKQAARLATIPWTHKERDDQWYLIEDAELREAFGDLIGQIAYSHWWDIGKVEKEFSRTIGAPVFCPGDWQVDPLKLACLMRAADAAHLDARRAPSFLRVLRKTRGISDDHWKFQNRLPKSRAENGRLVFATSHRFAAEDASAWWVCFDTLQMVDNELRHVDALLRDKRRAPFNIHGVAGVEDPHRLLEYVPTKGWIPVDAQVRVSDVPTLVERLGGKQLYGDDKTVALRELIQNAADAVRARRALDGHSHEWGAITVQLGEDEQGQWLEVRDTGIGMSDRVLAGPLLDFGVSYWGSTLAREECPGLLAKGFQPTGQYGIGFFSVFMCGNHVRVTSRRVEDGRDKTRVLEFATGLRTRPVLREARREEYITEGGSIVRVWLKAPLPTRIDAFSHGEYYRQKDQNVENISLGQLCAAVAPALDVNLDVIENGIATRVVCANDWQTLSSADLFRRITMRTKLPRKAIEFCRSMRPIFDAQEKMVGRARVGTYSSLEFRAPTSGIACIGGLRAGRDGSVAAFTGLVLASSTRSSRDEFRLLAPFSGLTSWANEQANLALEESEDSFFLQFHAHNLLGCGGDVSNLPIVIGSRGPMSAKQLSQWHAPEEILILQSMEYHFGIFDTLDFRINDNVLDVEPTGGDTLGSYVEDRVSVLDWPADDEFSDWRPYKDSLIALVVTAVAQAWKSSIAAVLRASELYGYHDIKHLEIGTVEGKSITGEIFAILRNPKETRDAGSQASTASKTKKRK